MFKTIRKNATFYQKMAWLKLVDPKSSLSHSGVAMGSCLAPTRLWSLKPLKQTTLCAFPIAFWFIYGLKRSFNLLGILNQTNLLDSQQTFEKKIFLNYLFITNLFFNVNSIEVRRLPISNLKASSTRKFIANIGRK